LSFEKIGIKGERMNVVELSLLNKRLRGKAIIV